MKDLNQPPIDKQNEKCHDQFKSEKRNQIEPNVILEEIVDLDKIIVDCVVLNEQSKQFGILHPIRHLVGAADTLSE